MSKHKKSQVEDPISPNLIPMIDIMFLLLLFFMLGADMAARETEDMELHEANKMVEIPKETDENNPETIVNIHHAVGGDGGCAVYDNKGICREKDHWKWSISRVSYDKEKLKERLQVLADLSLEDEVDKDAKKKLSKRKIMVRADKTAPYGDVQKVIEYCGMVGLYKISVIGAVPSVN